MRAIVMCCLGMVFGLGACKSAAEKCMETTEETYKRQVAECKDDACKAKALNNKLDFVEACKSR